MVSSEGIRALAQPIAAAAGLEVWDVEVAGGVVRILVDRSVPLDAPPVGSPDPTAGSTPVSSRGVDLDTLSNLSRDLSAALDSRDDLTPAGRYHLEVSSPGVERTLRTPEQYRRYVGSAVAVKLRPDADADGLRRLRGTLSAADDQGIVVVCEEQPSPGAEMALPYDRIERTRTVLVWGPAPKPGKVGAGRPGKAAHHRAAAHHAKDAS